MHSRSDGSLIIRARPPWHGLLWGLGIGMLCAIILTLAANLLFWDPFFHDPSHDWPMLIFIVGSGAVFLVVYWFVKKITPRTCFDRNAGAMVREPVDITWMGTRLKLEGVSIKLADIRAVQLCYGGREESDAKSASYDWWQLLVVDRGDPPLRVVICQAPDLSNLQGMASAIADVLRAPLIDNSSYRPNAMEQQEIDADAQKLKEEYCRELGLSADFRLLRDDRTKLYVGIVILFLALLAGFIWVQFGGQADVWRCFFEEFQNHFQNYKPGID